MVRVLVVAVVKAQDRLDQAEADDDAGGDDRGEENLGDAIVRYRVYSGSSATAMTLETMLAAV